jgi:anti-sigma factor RsiW
MDHETATQMNAPERYVIGDLSEADRDEFEEHFAGCSLCLDEVSTATAFAANARAVFRDRAVAAPQAVFRPARPWFLRWNFAIPALAAAALALFVVYQNTVTIPGLRAPQSFMAAVVLDGATRAALPRVADNAPLRFQMAVPPGAPARIWAELTDESGRVLSAGEVAVPSNGEPLDVYFPVHPGPNRYTIILRADNAGGAEISRNRFEITAQGASKP